MNDKNRKEKKHLANMMAIENIKKGKTLKNPDIYYEIKGLVCTMVPTSRIELLTSSLPWMRSTD